MLENIQRPIAGELERYTLLFKNALQADNELLAAALLHLTRKLGKMMRPTLVLLCAKAAGSVTDEVLHAAAGLEMLHTASLVHDDVVDESDMRRGQRSVNAIFDNKAAVLVGDFITSKALTEVALTRNIDVVQRMALLGQTLADGELLQLNNTHSTLFSEESYFDIISRKTAALFETCAFSGAVLAGADDDTLQGLLQFAHIVGLCFQMRDDIFDFDESLNVGKPKGNDLQEGKLTLPVLYVINNGDDYYRRLALKVRAHEASRIEIQELVEYTITHGGITYAEAQMQRLRDQALTILNNLTTLHTTSNTPILQSLTLYLDYVVQRRK